MKAERDQKMNSQKLPLWLLAGFLTLAAAGIILFIFLTPDGIGLVNDSVAYIGGARSLLSGDG